MREGEEIGLDDLPVGSAGRILSVAAEGLIRRRLLDLGFLPGTPVTAVRDAPLGDPRAYRLRGVTVALRNRDAAGVTVAYLNGRGA